MNRKMTGIIALGTFALVIVLGAWGRTEAQDAKGLSSYPESHEITQ